MATVGHKPDLTRRIRRKFLLAFWTIKEVKGQIGYCERLIARHEKFLKQLCNDQDSFRSVKYTKEPPLPNHPDRYLLKTQPHKLYRTGSWEFLTSEYWNDDPVEFKHFKDCFDTVETHFEKIIEREKNVIALRKQDLKNSKNEKKYYQQKAAYFQSLLLDAPEIRHYTHPFD